jgi:predicted transcriptional regulator
MSELLTLELPDQLARQARALAAATNRPIEEAIVEWIEKAVAELEVEALPNE